MMHSYVKTIAALRKGMVVVSWIIVLLYASVFVLATRYVVDHRMGSVFFGSLDHIPNDPVFILAASFAIYALLAYVLLEYETPPRRNTSAFRTILVEWALGFAVMSILGLSTQSLVLLMICDSLYRIRNLKKPEISGLIALTVFLYAASNYSIVTRIIPLPDWQQYVSVFPGTIRIVVRLLCSLLEGANLLLFFAFVAFFMIDQYEEKNSIARELDMVNEVNRQLRSYAALSEQIAESNERKRIAREIHDTLGHALTGIAAGIDACLIMIDKKPEVVKGQLQRIREVVTVGIGDVRNSLQKLRPGALEAQGLEGALKKMIAEFTAVSSADISLSWNMPAVDFEKAKEDALFRMIQECITNSIRHGHARHIDIVIRETEDDPPQMRIAVKDDGNGCETIRPGYGLMQMEERINTIHGQLFFKGTDGFLCEALIPLQKGEFDDQAFDRG